MIRVTYTPVCTLCEAECPSEEFSCIGDNRHPYPLPSERYTYTFGHTIQMCDSCAAPLKELRDKVVQAAIFQRNKT